MGLHQASEVVYRSVLRRSTAWVVPLVLTVLSLLASMAGPEAQAGLRYERAGIAAGDVWRLLTGHLAHLGEAHLLLNIAGLALVWLLVGSAYSAWRWVLVIVLSVGLIDLCFWFLEPGLNWYVGMSGLLHSLLAAGIVARLRAARGESLALGAIIAAKIAWEQMAGPLPGSEISAGGPVVVDAHFYGALAGIMAGAVVACASRFRAAPRAPI